MLTKVMVIISQYIHISNLYVLYLKLIQILYVNYLSMKLVGKGFFFFFFGKVEPALGTSPF